MKILLIDDHVLFRDGLQMVLEGLNVPLQIFEASSCEAAIDIIVEHRDMDLVLLDLGLPGLNDMDALMAIRQKLPKTPIVVLSGNDDSKKIEQVLRKGAQGYITKSSNSKIMLNALQLVIDGGIYVPSGILANSNNISDNSEQAAAGHRLTPRQEEVLQEMARGKSNKAIAKSLALTESTVRVHVAAVLREFNASNRTQAVQHAIKNGWVNVSNAN